MFDLGLSGSLFELESAEFENVHFGHLHDAAAAVVAGGQVLAAVEEERLNRLKHSNAFPSLAVPECVRSAGVRPRDLRSVAFFFGEDHVDQQLNLLRMRRTVRAPGSARERLAALVSRALDWPVSEAQITFVRHHLAHAAATFSASGFRTALVIVADGNGDDEGTSILRATPDGFEPLAAFPRSSSLGHYYTRVRELLGFGPFEEFKVMGLAPYGDPRVGAGLLDGTWELLPGGAYRLDWEGLHNHLQPKVVARLPGGPLSAAHADLAAGLQCVLQDVLRHLARHWTSETGLTDLCLTGGVAHNCTANGVLAMEGVASRLFVHPASHDGGASAGAAIAIAPREECARRVIVHANWGPLPGTRASIERALECWAPFIESEERADAVDWAAASIASGLVIGWVAGRAEFGPRALGNRSILADARLADMRDRLNDMVKKREGFRPFAPAVLAEEAAACFDLPARVVAPGFMSFAVPVRPEVRALLPAVTHVDGSARVQVVTREANERFWTLLRAFRSLTGCPVLLNTSLNSSAEPMVVTVGDGLRTLLTTGLDALVVDDWVIVRRPDVDAAAWLRLRPTLPHGTLLLEQTDSRGVRRAVVRRRQAAWGAGTEISAALARRLAGSPDIAGDPTELLAEQRRLWELRLIDLAP